MRFILLRHGETIWNVENKIQWKTDIPLNNHGKLQAFEFAKTLNIKGIEAIYSSSLMRAYETASIIGNYIKCPYSSYPGLEEMNLGIFEGMSWEQVEKKYPKIYKIWKSDRGSICIPEGENYEQVDERGLNALYKISVNHKDLNKDKKC